MQKSSIILVAVLLSTFDLYGSVSYTEVQTTGSYAPYSFRASGTDVLSPTSDEVLSEWQVLPFAWTFFGESVSGYYVSDNGYITFDNTATESVSANDLPPTLAAPNNAIYGFWDGLRIVNLGAADRVTTFTYGKAPARVHVIQWFSVSPASGSSFLYIAIRLYECGDFDVVLNYSNAVGMTATIGCENASGNEATVIGGSPNIDYPSGGTAAAGDDVMYRFFYNSQKQYDLRVLTLDVPYAVESGTDLDISGSVVNVGSETITSFTVSYTVDGAGPFVELFSGLNIPTGAGYSFTHATSYTPADPGHLDLNMWTSSLNFLNEDENPCDDSVATPVASTLGISGVKHVLIEEFSGAWCQFCPDGALILDDVTTQFSDVVYASIHAGGGDPPYEMEIPEGVAISGAFNDAFPKACIDRVYYSGEDAVAFTRSLWADRTDNRFNDPTPVDVEISLDYDDVARLVDVTVDIGFVDYAAGDLRVNVYVVEDSVTGSGTAYNQVNFYNTVAGHPFFGAGNPIVGYFHPRVLRMVPTSTWGEADVISETPGPSDNYEVIYSDIPIDPSFDQSQMYVLAFVSHHNDDVQRRTVLNSIEAKLFTPVVSVESSDAGLPRKFALYENYPNPFNPSTTIKYDLAKAAKVTLKVYNMLGQEIATLVNGSQEAGRYDVNWNGKNNLGESVGSGVYVFRIEAGDRVVSKKMLLIK